MNKICILGGGTAGYCTAAVLSRYVKDNNLDTEVKCIYSSKIGNIGVGESTQLAINDIFQFLRLRDSDWMPYANATYKSNIRFDGWSDETFYYPFGDMSGDDISNFFILSSLFPDDIPKNAFSRYVRDHSRYAELNRLSNHDWDFNQLTAYHFDTDGLSKVLYETAKANGTVFVDDEYIKSHLDKKGIEYIVCSETGKHEADLFIDCTGFRSLLLGEAMREPFSPYKSLINHRVIASKIPYTDKENQLTTYTNNVTMDNGWCWEIPLWDGLSVGYVHSLQFTTKEKIRQEFSDRYGDIPTKEIQFRTGRRLRAWVGNVVSVGLSYGFIEPLEATGLASIVTNIFRLLEVVSRGMKFNSLDRQSYNTSCEDSLDNSKTFIDMHYAASHKDDTEYWRHVTNEIEYDWNSHSNGRTIDLLCKDRNFSNKELNGGLPFILVGSGYGQYSNAFTRSLADKGYYGPIKDEWVSKDRQLTEQVLQCRTPTQFLKDTIYGHES